MDNNLFEYATKELSQDAFLCYLFAFEKDKESLPYPIAHTILQHLTIQENIQHIKRQEDKIDVLILTEKHALIIEDKIHTNEHDKQIETYATTIRYKYPHLKLIVVYIKTGFLSEQEKHALDRYKQLYKDKFFILTGQDLLNVIGSPEKYGDLIINQWVQWQQKQQAIIQQAKKRIIPAWNSLGFNQLSSDIEKQVYLDIITQKIRQNTPFQEASWWIVNNRTPHIELQTSCIEDTNNQIKYSTSAYIMFSDNQFSFTIKQHIFSLLEKQERIKPRNYTDFMQNCLEKQRQKIYHKNKQEGWGWTEKNTKLKILEKEFPIKQGIVSCLQQQAPIIHSLLDCIKK